MNCILRPILSFRATRAFFLVVSTLFCTIGFSQPILENCPPAVTNIVIETPGVECIQPFFLDQYPTSPDGVDNGDGVVTWYSTGATMAGSMGSPMPISRFSAVGAEFSFGLSNVVFLATNEGGTTECSTIVFVSEEEDLPTTTCDDITVDLNGECSGTLNVPYEDVEISTDVCDPAYVDRVELSWGMTLSEPAVFTQVVDAHSGNPSFYSLYLRKYRGDDKIRQTSCVVRVFTENAPEPALVCPSDETILVAAGCQTTYTYDVESVSTLDCGGSFNQTSGMPSGTVLAAGAYDYEVEMLDINGATVSFGEGFENPCNWTVTVEESDLASTSLACIGFLNVSIDQNCMATIDVPSILSGSLCGPTANFQLSATIDGEVQTGPTLTFTDAHVGETYDVSVIAPNAANSCWGKVTIEDKLGPEIICPADLIISCTMSTDTSETGVPELVGTECSDVTIMYTDASVSNMCSGDYQTVISRRFYAVDGSGNMGASCTQTINITRETLLNAVLPLDWDGQTTYSSILDMVLVSNPPLSCDGAGIVYDTIHRADGQVVPRPEGRGDLIGTGLPGGVGSCGTIFSFYEDIILDVCDENCSQTGASYKVVRSWDVFDWCTSTSIEHQQIIKVLDTIAPMFQDTVPDLTVSTDLWGCGATIVLPTVIATDNCSSEVKYSWNVSGGTYDAVNNTVYVASRALTNVDEEILLIAYAEDCCGNIAADTGKVTIVDLVPPVVVADEHTVLTLNNQSGDGHTKIYASSFDDGSWDGCGKIDWWVRRMDAACEGFDGDPDSTEVDEVKDFHKFIHFCCMDVAENHMVEFMVCDDADGDGTPEMNGDDNCSTAMVEVDVQDKLAPTITCPNPTSINCIAFEAFVDLLDSDLSETDVEKLEAQFGSARSNSTCGELGVQTFESGKDELCGIGDVTRTFVVTTSNGQATCSQKIEITLSADNVMSCDRISFSKESDEYKANYNWCDPSDLVTPSVKTIQVTECGEVNITRPIINIDGLCTEVGINLTLDTFSFAGGACLKILAHWEVIDQCLFEENYFVDVDEEINPFVNENGYYELYVEYDIFDTTAPELSCEDVTVATADCEYFSGSFTMSATDDCTAEDLISVTYKVDLNADGVYDIPAGAGFAEGNTFDAATIGGLPVGTHIIKWSAYDGCGNYAVCAQEIKVVKQDKAPTPYCHLGLSSAVMDSIYGCSVELWATDFVAGGFDDCDQDLTYLMIPYQDIYGDPADLEDDLDVAEALDKATPAWTFGCGYIENGKTHVVEIRIYTVDSDGNSDFCTASLTLNDNFDCCSDLEFGISTMIAGNVSTDDGVILESVNVSLMSDDPEFPRIESTSNEGAFVFSALAYDKNYDVTASNNNGMMEGVTTLDLVLIQRHILGLSTLGSPYKIIASDISGDSKVSALDLLQLRKLILGIYPNNQLPNNSSWRFIDNEFQFIDALRPFPFTENIAVNNLSQAMYNQNFVGVKIGDVNGSVSASRKGDAQVRSSERLTMTVADVLISKDANLPVDVTAAELASVYGMQLGFSFDNSALDYAGIESDVLNIDDSNVASSDEEIRISWNESEITALSKDDVVFTILFNGKKGGKLSEHLTLNSSSMKPEAYNEVLDAVEIDLVFRSQVSSGFALLQNEPNPFTDNTSITFNLPEAGSANMRVFDVTGKLILERKGDYSSGMNTMVIKKGDIRMSGILYYQLTYGKESATKKMILLD